MQQRTGALRIAGCSLWLKMQAPLSVAEIYTTSQHYSGGMVFMGQDPNQMYPGSQYGQPGVPPQGGYQQGAYQQPYQQPGAYPPPNTGYAPNPGYQQPNPNAGYQYQQPYGQPQGMYNVGNPLGPTSMNMQPSTAAGLSYLTWIGGLIVFLMEKQNRFVRFHAMQSIILSVAFNILEAVLYGFSIGLAFTTIGCVFLPVVSLLGLAGFVLWLICIINAFQGKYFKLPVIGDLAERWSNPGVPRV